MSESPRLEYKTDIEATTSVLVSEYPRLDYKTDAKATLDQRLFCDMKKW